MGWQVRRGLWKRMAGVQEAAACWGLGWGDWGLSPQPFPPKQESALKVLGTDGLFLFSSLDTDQDMYISPEEFKPIAEKLTGTRDAGHSRDAYQVGSPYNPPHTHYFGCTGCFGTQAHFGHDCEW